MDTLLALKLELIFAESVCKTLPLSEGTQYQLFQHIARAFNLKGLIPVAQHSTDCQEAKGLADLLRAHGSTLSVQKFKRKALKAKLIVIKPWPHPTKAGRFRHRVELTPLGRQYGADMLTEGQPIWFTNTFHQVLDLIS